MKFLILNGPNLNLLGLREPDIYGRQDYAALTAYIRQVCADEGLQADILQSNHEGEIVDAIQHAYYDNIDGIVINPAAYTHTSIAIADALRAVGIPAVEVHLSNPDEREDYRKISYVRDVCKSVISGHGFEGYVEAIDMLI